MLSLLTPAFQIEAFLSTDFECEVLLSLPELQKLSIARIQECDIVVVAESLLASPIYWERCSMFSGTGRVNAANRAGRYLQAEFEKVLGGLEAQAERLKVRKPIAARNAIKLGWKEQKELHIREVAIDKAQVRLSFLCYLCRAQLVLIVGSLSSSLISKRPTRRFFSTRTGPRRSP